MDDTKSDGVKVSILVVSKTVQNVSRLFECISHNGITESYEVLCSWNGSLDGQKTIECPNGMNVKIIDQRPYNFGKNNNDLTSVAVGEYLLFINDDVIPDRGSISHALKCIEDPSVGIVGINLRYADDRLQHAGIFFDENGNSYHRLKHEIRWDDPSLYDDMFVPCITGAFIMMRRAEFDQIKFDESFEICGEDIAFNLSYREMFSREILYTGKATAVHIENYTRKESGDTKTPQADMKRIQGYSRRLDRDGWPLTKVRRPRVRIITEKPGWIMYRKAEEIKKNMVNVRINEDWPEADIHYYINYGYFQKRPASGLVLANFTHYDRDNLGDKFESVAMEVDHCIAVSDATADILRNLGVPDEKISVILVGADNQFVPRLTLGIIGRAYSGERKGEDIVKALLEDTEITKNIQIVSSTEGWGASVWKFEHSADFYRAIDYLLVPSRIEGGPVPFMEALACGTMSVAPEIGVIPQFPHVSYPVGDVAALKQTLLDLAEQHLRQRQFISSKMKGINWNNWAVEHEKLFRRILLNTNK